MTRSAIAEITAVRNELASRKINAIRTGDLAALRLIAMQEENVALLVRCLSR